MKKVISIKNFVSKQVSDIKTYGISELFKKFYLFIKILIRTPINIIAILPCIIIRLMSPWIVIRIVRISPVYYRLTREIAFHSCKKQLAKNKPTEKYIDLFYIQPSFGAYNKQLVKMGKRKLNFFSSHLLEPINRVGKFIPGWEIHTIGMPLSKTGPDFNNLVEKYQPLHFTEKEKLYGKKMLKKFGLKDGDKFVCLAVRDSAYQLKKIPTRHRDWSYHDYRHWDLDNFLLAAEELTKKGYYVFRMGVIVDKLFKSDNPKIIDYANSSLRSDFLDVFLGAECSFCISTAYGFDGVPIIFRRPIVLLILPFGDFPLHSDRFLILTKHHFLKKENRRLTLSEIFSHGVAFAYETQAFEQKGIELVDNTPVEIKDVIIEMAENLEQKHKLNNEEEELQKTFKNLYFRSYSSAIKNLNGKKVKAPKGKEYTMNLEKSYGQIKSRFSSKFLIENKYWLK